MGFFQNLHTVKPVRVAVHGLTKRRTKDHPQFSADIELADCGFAGQRGALGIRNT
jgi:hypothetical protein